MLLMGLVWPTVYTQRLAIINYPTLGKPQLPRSLVSAWRLIVSFMAIPVRAVVAKDHPWCNKHHDFSKRLTRQVLTVWKEF